MQAAQNPYVALRKESVDRNPGVGGSGPGGLVALRKESVDRNPLFVFRPPESEVSLSARRAWIEIFLSVFAFGMPTVALRKESVDRNSLNSNQTGIGFLSLSARRAWIEIPTNSQNLPNR